MMFGKSFILLLRFLVKNAKKTTFLKINVFLVKWFIKLKCRRLQTGLAILKNIKHLIFFQMTDFYGIFKKHILQRYLKSSVARIKSLDFLCEHGRQNPTKVV